MSNRTFILSEDTDDNSEKEETEPVALSEEDIPKSVVQWQVDYHYKSEQERLNIPSDPVDW